MSADRQHLINTAVKFLQSETVRSKSPEAKRKYLSEKGLTTTEIEAILSGTPPLLTEQDDKSVPSTSSKPATTVQPPTPAPSTSTGSSLLRLAFNGAIISSIGYSAYNFVRQRLSPDSRGVDNEATMKIFDIVLKLGNNIEQLSTKVAELDAKLDHAQNSEHDATSLSSQSAASAGDLRADIKALQQEVHSLKALMLSRDQFAAAPKITPAVPSWQLKSTNGPVADETDSSAQD